MYSAVSTDLGFNRFSVISGTRCSVPYISPSSGMNPRSRITITAPSYPILPVICINVYFFSTGLLQSRPKYKLFNYLKVSAILG